jgi:hypothetical protein
LFGFESEELYYLNDKEFEEAIMDILSFHGAL